MAYWEPYDSRDAYYLAEPRTTWRIEDPEHWQQRFREKLRLLKLAEDQVIIVASPLDAYDIHKALPKIAITVHSGGRTFGDFVLEKKAKCKKKKRGRRSKRS